MGQPVRWLWTTLVVVLATGADVSARWHGHLPLPTSLLLLAGLLAVATLAAATPGALAAALGGLRLAALPLGAVTIQAGLTLLWSLLPGTDWSEAGRLVVTPVLSGLLLVATVALASLPLLGSITPLVARVALAASALSIVVDILRPATFGEHAARPAGLAIDPNAGALVLLLLAPLAMLGLRTSGRALVLGVIACLVVATLSRSGLLLLGLLVAGEWFADGRARVGRLRAGFAAAVLVGLVVLASLVAARLAGESGSGPFARFTAQERLAHLTSGRWIDLEDDRVLLIGEYLLRIDERPLFGHGTGYAHRLPRGPHNRYLQEWVNGGVPALLAFVGMLVAAAAWCWRLGDRVGLIVIALIAVGALFTHGILELRVVPIALGLVLARPRRFMSDDAIA